MDGSDIDALVADFQKVLAKHGLHGSISVSRVRTRDGFWSVHRDLFDWDHVDRWLEDVEVNHKAWLRAEAELDEGVALGSIEAIADHLDGWVSEGFSRAVLEDAVDLVLGGGLQAQLDTQDGRAQVLDVLCEQVRAMTLGQIRERYPGMYKALRAALDRFVDKANWMDLIEGDLLVKLYGIDDPEEHFNELDALRYWTVYFSPPSGVVDTALAFRCGLIPFAYRGVDYVALGAAGMDLSPRLDAYQALVVGSVPSDSRFLRDPEYARYVVGDALYSAVLQAIQTEPVFHIACWPMSDLYRAEVGP